MAELVTVVLADDAEDILQVVKVQLTISGRFEVVGMATTGAEAIRLAEQHQPNLVVLDVSMPNVDGLAALPTIGKVSPLTQVVMLSGFSSTALERSAIALGAIGFIDKGLPIEKLPERLLALIDKARVVGAPLESQTSNAPLDTEPEMVLARHQERFRTVFDQAAIGMATMTLTGTIVRANAVLANLLDGGGVVGQNYANLSTKNDISAVRSAIDCVGTGSEKVADCEHILQASGRWLHSTFASVQDEGGQPLYILAQAQDVTSEREAAQKLRSSEERFKLLVESVQDYAIFMLDPDGFINTWNLGAQRMKGYRAEEIIGQHFRVFYPEVAQLAKHPEQELMFASEHGRYQEEGWRVRKDGSQFWANVTITALFDEAGKLAGFGKVTRDVTEQRRSAEERERVAAELAAANASLQTATDAMADFVAVVAHELRSPVTAITGAAGLLRRHWEQLEASEREEMLTNIATGGARLQGLVSDLLVASRLEAGAFEFELEAVPVAQTISEVLDELRTTNTRDIELHCDVDLVARADRARFGQIVANLVSNAMTHGVPPIRIDATRAGSNIEVRVHDAGSISADVASHLFEKFMQGSGSRGRGSGLGLFIVRELARGQGGDAWYDAGPNDHTCFAFRLPIAG